MKSQLNISFYETIKDHSSHGVPGTLTYAAKTATFIPLGKLDAGTVYWR